MWKTSTLQGDKKHVSCAFDKQTTKNPRGGIDLLTSKLKRPYRDSRHRLEVSTEEPVLGVEDAAHQVFLEVPSIQTLTGNEFATWASNHMALDQSKRNRGSGLYLHRASSKDPVSKAYLASRMHSRP